MSANRIPNSMRRLALGALFATALGGCGPYFEAVSVPPPSRTAKLERQPGFFHDSYDVQISRGVALGFECYDGGPCQNASASVDDPKIAEVYAAHLDKLSERWSLSGANPKSGFVVIGKAAGETKIRVSYANGHAGVITLAVLDDPAPASATIAR